MTNPLQVSRLNNIATVKKTIAKSMPNGLQDSQLRAFLSVRYGFSDHAVTEYLRKLEDTGEIESFTEGEAVTWKMVVLVKS